VPGRRVRSALLPRMREHDTQSIPCAWLFTRLVALARRQKIAISGTEAVDGLKTRRYADLFLEASAHRCDLRRNAAGNKSRS
jgi:hypothetical protein